MTDDKKATLSSQRIGWFVIVLTTLVLGFDVYLATDGVSVNTYSEVIRGWANRWKILAYLITIFLGALVTHWFAKSDSKGKMSPERRLVVAGGLLLTLVAGMVIGFFW